MSRGGRHPVLCPPARSPRFVRRSPWRLEFTFPGPDGALLGSPVWVLLPIGVTIAAVVMVTVIAATRTRVMILAGATRRGIAVGMLAALPVILAYLAVVYGIAALLVGPSNVGSTISSLSVDVATLLLGGVLGVASAMLTGMVIVALFQAWPWWVGTIILTAVVAVLPPLLIQVDPGALINLGVGWEVLRVVVLVGLYWLLMRRLPVP